jgi:cleavage stimulation factor subunit 3
MLDEARSAFDSLLEQLNQNVEKLRESVQQEIQEIQENAEQERAEMNLGDDVDGELREQLRTRERQIKKKQDALELDLQKKVDVIMQQCSMVWIAYMRFARRTEVKYQFALWVVLFFFIFIFLEN